MSKDKANEWLKANDPEYGNRNKLEYAYLTGRQFGRRCDKEIPMSCLDTYIAQSRTGMTEEELSNIQEVYS